MAFDVTLNLTVGTVVSDKDECISEEDKVREEKERFKLKGQIRTLTNFEVRVSTLLAEHPSNLTAVREEVRAKEEPNFQLERIDFWMGKQCTMECDGSCPDVFQLTEIYPCDSWRESYRKAAVSPSDECGLGCPALSQTNQCNQKYPVDCMMFEVDKPCTVEREGSCPEAPQLKEICSCGGWQKSSCTAAVSPPDECGLGCPALIQTKQCNQRKCPVDCVMSEVDKPCTVEREGSCPEAPHLKEIWLAKELLHSCCIPS